MKKRSIRDLVRAERWALHALLYEVMLQEHFVEYVDENGETVIAFTISCEPDVLVN